MGGAFNPGCEQQQYGPPLPAVRGGAGPRPRGRVAPGVAAPAAPAAVGGAATARVREAEPEPSAAGAARGWWVCRRQRQRQRPARRHSTEPAALARAFLLNRGQKRNRTQSSSCHWGAASVLLHSPSCVCCSRCFSSSLLSRLAVQLGKQRGSTRRAAKQRPYINHRTPASTPTHPPHRY
jgi:hypothetical protein